MSRNPKDIARLSTKYFNVFQRLGAVSETVVDAVFVLEIDKLKTITRNTLLTDRSRLENAAEHSWHVAVAAPVFPGDLIDSLTKRR